MAVRQRVGSIDWCGSDASGEVSSKVAEQRVRIETKQITDWESLHAVFQEAFGFPDFYGRNMDAWIDCLTYLDDPDAGMTTIHVDTGNVLVLCISGMTELKKRCPEIYESLVECSAFVNWRRIERGEPAVLALSFYD